MSYKHYNELVDAEEIDFDSALQRFIFLEACYRADNRGILRIPQSHLAGCCLLSRQTIAKEFNRLVELGLLVRRQYGQYQVGFLGNGASSPPLRTKLIRWLTQEWDEYPIEGNVITIMEGNVPEFFAEAVNGGYLEFLEGSRRQSGGEFASNYKVHLNP